MLTRKRRVQSACIILAIILQNTKKGMKRIITMDSKRIQIPKQTSGSLNIVVILLFQEKEKEEKKHQNAH